MNSCELALKVRRHIVEMIHNSHASHISSCLSCVDIIAVLYSDILNVQPNNPSFEERDRFIMSKGHGGATVYATLAECGFFPTKTLENYYMNGSILSGHISHKNVPGVEVSTGSLGHGIAIACGMAMAAKIDHANYKVYALIGDGECDEGVVWEAALNAAQRGLDNFTVIVDRNNLQAMGRTEDILKLEPFADKWRSFGWNVIDLPDGGDHDQLRSAFNAPFENKPKCIIARTVKGKGISFMENNLLWHYRDPQGIFYTRALEELEASQA